MKGNIRHLLVPVDFSLSTPVAVAEALKLATEDTTIHLLHIQYYGYPGLSPDAYRFIWPDEKKDYERAVIKLDELRNGILAGYPELKVSTHIDNRHNLQEGIEKMAIAVGADLVIICKKSSYSWFPFLKKLRPERLARRTSIPVLILRPGAARTRVNNLIFQTELGSDAKGLGIINALCQALPLKPFAVSFQAEPGAAANLQKAYLLRAYECIKATGSRHLEHIILFGQDKARALLDFAKEIDGDMIITSPGRKLKRKWPGRYLSDAVSADSKLRILVV